MVRTEHAVCAGEGGTQCRFRERKGTQMGHIAGLEGKGSIVVEGCSEKEKLRGRGLSLWFWACTSSV